MPNSNTYGIVRPTLISAEDVDIFYNYKPNRSAVDEEYQTFTKVEDPSTMLTNANVSDTTISDPRLPGMYNLSLPVSIFGRKGIYTVYIKPREIECTIHDIGALTAYPDVRGIVINLNTLTDNRELFKDDNLVGYRVEYYSQDSNGVSRQDFYRIVTSANLCEPLSQNLTTANTNSNGYRYNASGSLSFITLTPSVSPSFKPNAKPYIGVPNQKIVLSNTKFDPVCIEIEMVEHDIETVSYMLEGEQIRNLENGRVTTYNFDGEIYKQMEYSTIKDNYTNKAVAEAKLDRSGNIDNSLDLEEIKES